MVSRHSRRTVIQSALPVLGLGLAGCNFSQSGSPADGGEGEAGTLEPGRAYSIRVTNDLTRSDLESATAVSPTARADVSLEAEENYEPGGPADVTLFSRSLALETGAQRTVPDAFETRPDGPEYVVSGHVAPFRGPEAQDRPKLGAAYRFEPAGYQAPTGAIFEFRIRDVGTDSWEPAITVVNTSR